MKFNFSKFGMAALLSGMSFQSLAANPQAPASDPSYPYIAPDSSCPIINVPPGIAGVMFSQNCKTVFLLPPEVGTTTLTAFAPSENLVQCEGYDRATSLIDKLTQSQNQLIDRLSTATDPVVIAQFQQLMKNNDDLIQKTRDLWGNIEGATAQLTFDSKISEDVMKTFMYLNAEALRGGLTVMTAPIAQGFLSVSTKSGNDIGNALISSSVPGLKTAKGDNNATIYSGGASGQIVLSLAGACPLFKTKNYKVWRNLAVDDSVLNSYLVANYTYAIPVKTGVKFTAELNLDRALDLVKDITITNGRFSVTQAANLIINPNGGNSNEVVSFKVDAYEIPAALQGTYTDFLKDDVAMLFAENLTRELVALDILKQTDIPVVKTPEAGDSSEARTRNVCHQAGGFAGMFTHNECSDETYYEVVHHDGYSHEIDSLKGKISIQSKITNDDTGVIYRTNTSTFAFKKGN